MCVWAIKLILFSFLIKNLTLALYEDQIKKFDWRIQNIGKLKDAFIDTNSNNRIIVASEQNVLSAISTKSGEIIWRQVFESNTRGHIKLIHVQSEHKNSTITNNQSEDFDIITVSGYYPALIRGWSSKSGLLNWEWSLIPLQLENAENAVWFYNSLYLYHVISVWGSHLEITKYFATTGKGKGTTEKIIAPWINSDYCTVAPPFYACLDKDRIQYINLLKVDYLLDVKLPVLNHKSLNHRLESDSITFKGTNNAVKLDNTYISLLDDSQICAFKNDIIKKNHKNKEILLQTYVENEILHINSIDSKTCKENQEINFKLPYPKHHGKPTILDFNCKSKKVCEFIISTEDEAVLFIENDKIKWTREESLANIVGTEIIDLLLSDDEGDIENTLKNKPGDVKGYFTRRLVTQFTHFKNLFLTIMGLGLPQTASQKAGLVRDAFGLHKMILFITNAGKIFGIDNLTGKIHWAHFIQDITNFNNNQKMKFLIQRTSKFFPHHPICALIGKNKVNGNGLIFQFDPINGLPVSGGLYKLTYPINQASLLHEMEKDFSKAILILDDQNLVHVIPEKSSLSASGMFYFIANKENSSLFGYVILQKQGKLVAEPTWEIHLSDQINTKKIIAVVGKNPVEHVHSQGRVLSDRSVLYKYINPNLVAVVTQGPDNIHKYVLNVHLVDVVSGALVHSLHHRKVRGPLNIVHSENWLVYSYYNEKARRTELTTIELYEGKEQTNGTVWSSFDAPHEPMIEKQSYIFPAIIKSMRETITERGITNKHVLIGLANGGIVEMPWALLDPRRPISASQIREEGSIPYIPELPIPTENIINYNQSISDIRNIYTAPSGLESTCLVVVYGLDLFVTRVSPSKTFDLLKEDFDYFLITVVLIALTTASFVVKNLASRKAIKQAWK